MQTLQSIDIQSPGHTQCVVCATGHYELTLEKHSLKCILNRLCDIAKSQVPAATFRNLFYQHSSVVRVPFSQGVPSLLKGGAPSAGTISFDFVSFGAVPSKSMAMTDDEFNLVSGCKH